MVVLRAFGCLILLLLFLSCGGEQATSLGADAPADEPVQLHSPAANELIFGSDPWPPYAGVAGSKQQGFIVDVLKEIYEPAGYIVTYVNMPWSRCLTAVREGRMHGLAGCDVKEAPDFEYPAAAIGITRPSIYMRPGAQWSFAGMESLKSIKLGFIQDYTYTPVVDDFIHDAANAEHYYGATGSDALSNLMNMLQLKRIDAFIENKIVVDALVQETPSLKHDFSLVSELKPGVVLYVPFSPLLKNKQELAALFDQGIERLRTSGRLNEILQSYGQQDWNDAVQRQLQSDK